MPRHTKPNYAANKNRRAAQKHPAEPQKSLTILKGTSKPRGTQQSGVGKDHNWQGAEFPVLNEQRMRGRGNCRQGYYPGSSN